MIDTHHLKQNKSDTQLTPTGNSIRKKLRLSASLTLPQLEHVREDSTTSDDNTRSRRYSDNVMSDEDFDHTIQQDVEQEIEAMNYDEKLQFAISQIHESHTQQTNNINKIVEHIIELKTELIEKIHSSEKAFDRRVINKKIVIGAAAFSITVNIIMFINTMITNYN